MNAQAAALNPSEIHYQLPERIGVYQTTPTIDKVIQLSRNSILGESNLFNYDSSNKAIVLSPSFENLLKLLVDLKVLNSKALTAASLPELNAIFQQEQTEMGGLLRKPGTERWDLEDQPSLIENRHAIVQLLQQLGFVSPKAFDCEICVNHCIIFGALVERMETRIIETLNCLNNGLKVAGHIFLLGSNRKLIAKEIDDLKSKLETVEGAQKDYWNEVFNDPDQLTEANAFTFLWEYLLPKDRRIDLGEKLIGIKSTRMGYSYHERSGHRATTEVTIDDWMSYYDIREPQAIFALAEQPYIRLPDQLRMSVISKGKNANLQELIDRINQTTFYFPSPNPSAPPLISVIFDEIARNVYRVKDSLEYLNRLNEVTESTSSSSSSSSI